VRLLQVLRDVTDVETHLVMSAAARQTLALETDLSVRDVQALANVNHDTRDIAASISSGSFRPPAWLSCRVQSKRFPALSTATPMGCLPVRQMWC
jgi:3-polyprenyl-4-hydroxybenzoate decarboxylase